MTPDQIRLKLRHQGPEAHRNMMQATGLASLRLERWQNSDDSALHDEDVAKLRHWCRGEYGMDSVSDGWILKPTSRGKSVAAAVLPSLHIPAAVDYGNPARGRMMVKAGPTVASVGKLGKDLPGADQLIMQARRKADEVAEQEHQRARAAEGSGLKRAVTQALWPQRA